MEELYQSDAYARIVPTWHVEDSPWKSRKILGAIPHSFYDEVGESVHLLDLGCGAGEILSRVARGLEQRGLVVDPIGLDISPHALEMARRRLPCARFIPHTIEEADLEPGSVDLLLAIDVIEHIEEPERTFSVISKVARHVIVHLPLEDNLNVDMRRKREGLYRDGHIHFYNIKSARNLFESAGFRVMKWFYTCFDVDGDYQYPSRLNRYLGRPLRRLLFELDGDILAETLGCSAMFILESASTSQRERTQH